MSVRIIIGGSLKHYTCNEGLVRVKGDHIGACLMDLSRQYPEIKKSLFDRNGNLTVFIFHNGKYLSQKKDLTKPVKNGDEFHILPVIGGG
jgi:molybdopterin converting factor small subunit